jgi:integrase
MAREVGKLPAVALRSLPVGRHSDGGGLYVQVTQNAVGGKARSWLFRYSLAGKSREMGLGPLHTLGLAEARAKARELRKQVLDGEDPIATRNTRRQAATVEAATGMTFQACAEAYIAAHQAGWRNPKHRAQWPATLSTYAYPVFGSLPVQSVDVGLVMKALEPIWQVKPETASRVRGRIEAALDWATARGYRQGENPARWRGHLENLLPKKSKMRRVEHHAALPYSEIAEFMAELRKQEGVAALALELTILTAARTGEVLGARWDEINPDGGLWIVPAERMKAGREHRVPLSDAAMKIIEKMASIRLSDYIFPGQRTSRPLSQMAMLMLLRRMGRGDLTAHGFRSTFSDWCAEQTNFPSEVREMALAHTVSDKVEAAYRRGDLFQKRRELAEAWAQYCDGEAPTESKVVRLAGRAGERGAGQLA